MSEIQFVTYGLNCSTFLALTVVKRGEKDEGLRYPKAAPVNSNDIQYM